MKAGGSDGGSLWNLDWCLFFAAFPYLFICGHAEWIHVLCFQKESANAIIMGDNEIIRMTSYSAFSFFFFLFVR